MNYEVGALLRDIPIFPLPQVVLFPGTLLPLHIFEPRYRAMTAHALDQKKPLCLAMISDAEARADDDRPLIATIAGIGDIIRHRRLPDGRYDILVQGRARVRLAELPFEPPFRRANAEVLASGGPLPSGGEIAALVSAATSFATRVAGSGRAPSITVTDPADAGALADACAHALVIEGEDRQRVLETLDVRARVRRTAELLAMQDALAGRESSALN